MRKIIVPPGGFLGWNQQTVAVQALLSRPATRKRRSPARRKTTRRKKAPTRRRATRRTTARKKRPAYMVKGSAAAKRRMAQLRKMRKK